MHHYPTAHTLSELSIHRYYKDLLPVTLAVPSLLFTSLVLTCTQLHTRMHALFSHELQPTQSPLFTHSYNTSLPLSPPPPRLPPPLAACHFAFGQHEPEWSKGVSAMHMKRSLHPDMHVSGEHC